VAGDRGRALGRRVPWPDGRAGAEPPDVARTELAVAPSIVVPLARAVEDEDGAMSLALDPVDALRAELAASSEHTRRLEAEVAFLRREREDVEAARRERDEARAERGRVAAEAGDVDGLRGERDRLEGSARDAARAATKLREERDGLRGKRDAALGGLEKLALERDALRQELDERDARAAGAARRREQALEERDAARRDGERAAESARAERDAARAELETAAARERARAEGQLAALRERLDVVEDERDRALEEPAGVAGPPARTARAREPVSAHADWAARTAAILAVLVLLVLAITFLKAIA
jgi:chromosome segregation ATPase